MSAPYNQYAPPNGNVARDTALQDYTPSNASKSNGTSNPTKPNGQGPGARFPVRHNSSLTPMYSPTSHGFARRSDSPPASTYWTPASSSNHRMTPVQGSADEVKDHFSFSTTLRRHTLGPAEDLLPFSRDSGSRRGTIETGGGFEGRVRELIEPAVSALGLEKYLPSRKGDDYELESSLHDEPDSIDGTGPPPPRVRGAEITTFSARWASMATEDVLSTFGTNPDIGLPSSSVPDLRTRFGYNEFTVAPKGSMLRKFIETIYESPLNLLLLGSAAISAIMGNIDDAVSITIAILIVLTVGFVQERRSEKSLEALNKLVPHHCHLLRDSHQTTVLANELLPGDIVSFTVGDRIPADVRLLTAVDLEIDESSLTGEALAVRKVTAPCSFSAPLGERNSMAFMGTLVRGGRGVGIVVATGEQTEFGAIFATMQDIEEKRTPLQTAMDDLGARLSKLSFAIIGVICVVGVLQSRSWLEMFTIGVSLAVAAIPEGLPIVTTVTLALGVLRMAKRKAIVKKLPSVEALGCVSVICCDKTGTLTKNEQTVTEIYTVDDLVKLEPIPDVHRRSSAFLKTIQVGAICNDAKRNGEGIIVGQSTDIALFNVVEVLELPDQRKGFTVAEERPFSSDIKSMALSGSFATDSRQLYLTKGALEIILPRCRAYHVSDDSAPALDALTRSLIISKASAISSRGMRVVAMAYAYGSLSTIESATTEVDTSRPNTPHPQANLIFAGFQAMMDPPRKGVSDAISSLHEGGVKVVMITGDSAETAMAIGRQLGLLVHGGTLSVASSPTVDKAGNIELPTASIKGCMTGKELDALDDQMLRERVGGISVFARTSPRHKMRIVAAYQARGAVVGMTGDGVNDAPALKMADIGVAMGSGTDVAKEAADVILVDDNFTTILAAIEEGKTIFHNIQQFLAFQLSTALSALLLISLSTFFGWSNPLNAMQILFINILMDGPPSQSLGVDPADHAVMKRPPRAKSAPVIDDRVIFRVLFSASIMVVLTLFVYLHELSDGMMSRRDQTMTFTLFVFLDLASAIQNRGLGCAFTQNKMLLTTVSSSFIVQLGLIYLPVMQSVFQTEALAFRDLFKLLVLGATALALHEGRRRYEKRKERENEGVRGGWDSRTANIA